MAEVAAVANSSAEATDTSQPADAFRANVCLFLFVSSNFLFQILDMFPELLNDWQPCLQCLNVVINTTTLICSFSNYRERLFPFGRRSSRVPESEAPAAVSS